MTTDKTAPRRIEVTEELIKQLHDAQLDWTKEMIERRLEIENYSSDDSFRDMLGALSLAKIMTEIWLFFRDTKGLDALLNTPGAPGATLYSSFEEGMAPAFYDLNCPADEEED